MALPQFFAAVMESSGCDAAAMPEAENSHYRRVRVMQPKGRANIFNRVAERPRSSHFEFKGGRRASLMA
jgi:hypothetical protein